MLKSLQIKDYALIENINVDFGKGLNIITGETGAGKSILIGALGLLLGERASTETVRKGANKSFVEGIFDVKDNFKIKKLFEENDIDFEDELIIRREISLKGSNRCFINDTPVSLNVIKDAGNLLVDLHGQHEHQSLLRTETHIEMLDEFVGAVDTSENFYKELNLFITKKNELEKLINDKKTLIKKEQSLKEKSELYGFQIKEIDAVSPEDGEEEKLEEELKILENSAKLFEVTNEIYNRLYESENAIYDGLVEIRKQLFDLARIDNSFKEKENECESAIANINDIADFLRSYRDNIDLEATRLDEVRERLGALHLLKKKYGGTIEKVVQYRKQIGEEFELAESFTDKINELDKFINQARVDCGNHAAVISSLRKKVSLKIKKEIESSLLQLGIADSKFEVRIHNINSENNSENYLMVDGKKFLYNNSGIDEVEFYISTNLGEDLKPLAKIASGGEVSRIMLALKTILAKNDKLPLLIFDEIDVGVSGRIGQKVGIALKELSKYHQIIAITHLPQIAGLADNHYSVEKQKANERVTSFIKKLSEEEKIKEVAKLISGDEITEASLKGAQELMGKK